MADAQYMLHKWQVGYFDCKNGEKTPSQRADAIISSLSQVCLARAANRIPAAPWCNLMDGLMRKYSFTIDCSTDQGVNNYAEGGLAVSGHYAADSSHWKSSLDEKQIKTSESYLELLKASQQEQIRMRAQIVQIFSELKNGTEEQSARGTSTYEGVILPETEDGLNNNHQFSQRAQQATRDGIAQVSIHSERPSGHDGQQNRSSWLGQPPPESETTPNMNHDSGQKSNPLPGNVNWAQGEGDIFSSTGPSCKSMDLSEVRPPANFTPHEIGPDRNDGGGQKSSTVPGSFNWALERDGRFPRNGSSLKSMGSSGGGLFANVTSTETGHRDGQRNTLPQGSFSGTQGGDSYFQQAGPSVGRSGSSAFESRDQASRVQESSFRRDAAACEPSVNLARLTTGEGIWQNHSMKRKKSSQNDFRSDEAAGDDRPPGKTGPSSSFGSFKTARQQLTINNQQNSARGRPPTTSAYGTGRKVLGVTRKGRGLNSKFVPPVLSDDGESNHRSIQQSSSRSGSADQQSEEADERLQGIDPKMVDLIMKEIMDHGPPVTWDDIAGLEYAKKTIKEIVVWPMLRPDIFHGLRGPPKGLLLFGPPGTGKTLIGKCIASQSKSTFFSISASSLTSKWVGEGEKMVRALFTIARCHQPAVIFIDEIDSLLSQRSTDEHESSRRIKTEFLIQLDGATSSDDDRILVVGATNRPQEIDEAARRRLVKRLYIPLPDLGARRQIILHLLSAQGNYSLSDDEVSLICEKTDGYSGADVANLCREAALGPIRSLDSGNIQHVSVEEVRPISYKDFVQAVEHVKPSVSPKDLEIYLQWNQTYGSGKA